VCVHAMCARVRAKRTHARVRLFLDRLCPNLLGTYFKSPQVAWAMYVSCPHTARMRVYARVPVRAWLSIRLSLDGLSSNLLGTYFKSPQEACATYFLYSRIACTGAIACVVSNLPYLGVGVLGLEVVR
jgi:hypothetical protein